MRRLSAPYLLVIVGCVALIAASIYVGASWSAGQDTTAKIAIWDLVLKVLAGFLALTGAALAVFRYLDDRAKVVEAALLEARKPFLIKRQEIYSELVVATALISTIEDYGTEASEEAERQFWALFWGMLPMVTDESVSKLVDDFSEVLANRRSDWVPLRNLSMNISRACRNSMGFDPPLPPPAAVTLLAEARPGP